MDQIFLRIALWLRRPPSRQQVLVGLVVLALSALLVGIEWMGWWPSFLHASRVPSFPPLR